MHPSVISSTRVATAERGGSSYPHLVNALAWQRLVARLVDWAAPILVASFAVLPGLVGRSGPSGPDRELLVPLLGLACIAGYQIWLWLWEASAGKTPGSLLLGIRTCGQDGLPAGIGAIFVRTIILAASAIVPVLGPLVVLVSNRWDPNEQRQGWHDQAAGTLVVDVRAGRNPLLTGGRFGAQAFAPEHLAHARRPGSDAPSVPALSVLAPPVPLIERPPFEARPAGAGRRARTPDPAPAAGPPDGIPVAHPDEELELTRIAQGKPATAGVQLVFDDGAVVRVPGGALLGRNPSVGDDPQEQLIDFADLSRSVSKTHLHLRAEGSGLWVTDRNSTNGSAVTTPAGVHEELPPGVPVLAPSGSTVHFGDRYFIIAGG